MSRLITSYYCSCSKCTRARNEPSKQHRFFNLLRNIFTCTSTAPKKNIIDKNKTIFSSLESSRPLTVSFRDIDITNKHCSKHRVLVKTARPYFTKLQHQELRQRVRDANQRWTRMSILPMHFIDFIFKNKDFIPLCTACYMNLSLLQCNLCHECIQVVAHCQLLTYPTNVSESISDYDSITLSTKSQTTTFTETEEESSLGSHMEKQEFYC